MNNCEVRDWTTLGDDVVGEILEKLISLYDYLQFSMVCKSWYFSALSFKRQRSIITSKFPQLPMLLVPNSILPNQLHSLYDLRTNDIRPVHFNFLFNKRCSGSSFGWLIMLEESLHVSLFNPFTGAHILLPPIDVEPDLPNVYFTHGLVKAILTKDPSLYPNDYMVVAICTSIHKICLMKASDQIWIYQNPEYRYGFGEVNLCNDTLYVTDHALVLKKIEVSENSSISFKAITSIYPMFRKESKLLSYEDSLGHSVYIVESSKKEILLVKRLYSIKSNRTEDESIARIRYVKTGKFLIYKLSDECDENGLQQIIEVESLDGDTMFIGDNQSFCISSKDFPKCQSNCIYFTDNCYGYVIPFTYGPQDAGIYNLENKSFSKHYITDPLDRNLPPPIWIVPTICFKDSKG